MRGKEQCLPFLSTTFSGLFDLSFLRALSHACVCLTQDLDIAKIGTQIMTPGQKIGCVTAPAAAELGLPVGTPVACGLIDAHAGALGLLATQGVDDFSSTLCLISGTSACHMLLNRSKLRIPGVWGPYYSAILKDYWLHEGGQSAVGSLIDHLIQSHPAFKCIESKTKNVYQYLEEKCIEQAAKENLLSIHCLTRGLHILPDFHGNRSPWADSEIKGIISGLELDRSELSLAKLYLAAIQAIAYGTKAIVEQLVKHGHSIDQVAVCGGLAKSSLFIQTHADVLNLRVIQPHESESVLLGSAILAKAAFSGSSLEDALKAMQGSYHVFHPNPSTKTYHHQKFAVFQELLQSQWRCRELMSSE